MQCGSFGKSGGGGAFDFEQLPTTDSVLIPYRSVSTTHQFSCSQAAADSSRISLADQRKQEKPTNCGTKAADVLDIFLSGKL